MEGRMKTYRWPIPFYRRTACLAVLVLPLYIQGNTFKVTHTADTGESSLRWAIESANAHAGPDTVIFAIPVTDAGFNGRYWTIAPLSELPGLTDAGTLIDGLSQANRVGDFNPNGPEIFLDGRSAGSETDGLNVLSSDNVIEGLAIGGFTTTGITIEGADVSNNLVYACYVGVSPEGDQPAANRNGIRIFLGPRMNWIGRPDGAALERNVISANTFIGIAIAASDENKIFGNFIGTDSKGSAALPNGVTGVFVGSGSRYNKVGDFDPRTGNLISGNNHYGVLINGTGTTGNDIMSSLIGTDVTGMHPIPNTDAGVRIEGGASINWVGIGNIISGNAYGVIINGVKTDSNLVCGNCIGLDKTGKGVVPNTLHGVRIEDGARYNFVGGFEGRNVVSGNGWSGLCTVGDSTAYNEFLDNYCGTDTSGTLDLGNVFYGAHFGGLANVFRDNLFSGNRCGMVISGYSEKCVVAGNSFGVIKGGGGPLANDEAGIRVLDNAQQNEIRENTICDNHGWGVELKGAGVQRITLSRNSLARNDSGGIALRDGANNSAVPPAVTGVTHDHNYRISGTGPRKASVEIFSDNGAQGGIFLGSVVPNDDGLWDWRSDELQGAYVTATSTDRDGNTSEFSPPVSVPSAVNVIDPEVPDEFALTRNFPNPFNPRTRFFFDLPGPADVELAVLDLTGRKVAVLRAGRTTAGRFEAVWEGTDTYGKPAPSGVYCIRLCAGGRFLVQKITLLR